MDELPRFRNWRVLVMSRPYDVSDFSRLLEKAADDRPLGRSRWSSGRQRGEARPEREEVIGERLANRYRKTYPDRTRNYALRESEIFMLKELGKFRVISDEDLSQRSITLLLVLTGLRVGELLALRWGSIDLNARSLRVCETVYDGHLITRRRSAALERSRSDRRQRKSSLRSVPPLLIRRPWYSPPARDCHLSDGTSCAST